MKREVRRHTVPAAIDPFQLPPIAQPRFAQTWTSNVFVPLVQNLLGGIAVAGLGIIAVIARTGALTAQPTLWCVLAGGVVSCIATVVRFFGDETGLMLGAYRLGFQAGRQYAEATINRLTLELTRIKQDAAAANATHGSVPVKLSTAQSREHQIYLDALRLLQWGKGEHVSTDRRSCEVRGMSQTAWRHARDLLIEAGVMNDAGYFVLDLPEALPTLKRTAQARSVIAVQGGTGEDNTVQSSAIIGHN